MSASNVYLYEGRGLLGDLEYSKSTGDHSHHDVRTVGGMCLLGNILA
jgi:hypothetical protein